MQQRVRSSLLVCFGVKKSDGDAKRENVEFSKTYNHFCPAVYTQHWLWLDVIQLITAESACTVQQCCLPVNFCLNFCLYHEKFNRHHPFFLLLLRLRDRSRGNYSRASKKEIAAHTPFSQKKCINNGGFVRQSFTEAPTGFLRSCVIVYGAV